MAQQLPNNDPDLQLAQKIGELLAGDQPLESIDNPLIRELSAFRLQREETIAAEQPASEKLWNRIENETTGREAVTKFRLLDTASIRWAAAAAVLIAALVGFVYSQFLQGPMLIAESKSAMETVQLADGSVATLRPHTQLYQVSENDKQSIYRLAGEAYFEVRPDPERNFTVEAGNGTVSVLGTKFTVSSWGKLTQVYLEEGTVLFTRTASDQGITLEPGQIATLGETQRQPVLTTGSSEEYTDWLKNELVFDNRPARRIFNELEQHFGISLSGPDNVLNNSLSGSLSLESRDAALRNLALSLGGEFSRQEEETYTFIPSEN